MQGRDMLRHYGTFFQIGKTLSNLIGFPRSPFPKIPFCEFVANFYQLSCWPHSQWSVSTVILFEFKNAGIVVSIF